MKRNILKIIRSDEDAERRLNDRSEEEEREPETALKLFLPNTVKHSHRV